MPPVSPVPPSMGTTAAPPPPPPPAPRVPTTEGPDDGVPENSGIFQWILRILGIIALFFVIRSFFNEGDTSDGEMVRGSHAKFLGFFIFFSLLILAYRFIPREGGKTKVRGVDVTVPAQGWPHIAVTAALLGTTLFNWLWWSTSSGTWEAWRNSERFWPMTVAIIFTAILSGQANAVAKLARYMLIGLVLGSIFLGIGSYAMANYCWAIPNSKSELRKEKGCTEKTATGTASTTASSSATSEAATVWDWRSITGPEMDTVMAAFPDDTVMQKIAAAESDYTQFRVNASGDSSVVQNKNGVDAYGIFQIRKSIWGNPDKLCGKAGLDIFTTAGNIACAKLIKAEHPDLRPWFASAHMWRNGIAVDPCTKYARYGGDPGLEVVRTDTVIALGDDTLYTRRIETEGFYSDWSSVNFRTDYMVRYAYRDPITQQVVVAEEVLEKENCPEENRLPRHPIWVEFKTIDADPVMIEVILSRKVR